MRSTVGSVTSGRLSSCRYSGPDSVRARAISASARPPALLLLTRPNPRSSWPIRRSCWPLDRVANCLSTIALPSPGRVRTARVSRCRGCPPTSTRPSGTLARRARSSAAAAASGETPSSSMARRILASALVIEGMPPGAPGPAGTARDIDPDSTLSASTTRFRYGSALRASTWPPCIAPPTAPPTAPPSTVPPMAPSRRCPGSAVPAPATKPGTAPARAPSRTASTTVFTGRTDVPPPNSEWRSRSNALLLPLAMAAGAATMADAADGNTAPVPVAAADAHGLSCWNCCRSPRCRAIESAYGEPTRPPLTRLIRLSPPACSSSANPSEMP